MQLTPDKKLHSREHVLADDLAQQMCEPKRFGAYLGIAKRYHESDLRGLARRVLEKENLPSEARGKYFFAVLRTLPATPEARKKSRAKKKKRKTRKPNAKKKT